MDLVSTQQGVGKRRSDALVVESPLGQILVWEEQGRIHVQEAGADGLTSGALLTLGDPASHNHSFAAHVSRAQERKTGAVDLCVAWVAGEHGASASGGRIMLQRCQLLGQAGREGDGRLGSLTPTAAANDNGSVVAEFGCEPQVALLERGEALVAWIDPRTGDIRAELCPPSEGGGRRPEIHGSDALSIRIAASVGPGVNGHRRLQVAELGPAEFAILWLSRDGAHILGRQFYRADEPANGSEIGAGWQARDLAAVAASAHINWQHSEELAGADRQEGRAAGEAYAASTPVSQDAFLFGADLIRIDPAHLAGQGRAGPRPGHLEAQAGQPLVVEVCADQAVHVAAINGITLSAAAPVRLEAGWVQLRADGDITFTPDADFSGAAHFAYTLTDGRSLRQEHVEISVAPALHEIALELCNPVRAIPGNASFPQNARVADIAIAGDMESNGVVTLSGPDAAKFSVIGNGLYLKAGARLEDGRKGLNVTVNVKDALFGAVVAASLTILIVNDPNALLSMVFADSAAAEPGLHGAQVVANLAVLDQASPERTHLSLLNSAGGRFGLIGNTLVVADESLLQIDLQPSYDLALRTTHANGVSYEQTITVSMSELANRIHRGGEPLAPAEVQAGNGGGVADGEGVAHSKPGAVALAAHAEDNARPSQADQPERAERHESERAAENAAWDVKDAGVTGAGREAASRIDAVDAREDTGRDLIGSERGRDGRGESLRGSSGGPDLDSDRSDDDPAEEAGQGSRGGSGPSDWSDDRGSEHASSGSEKSGHGSGSSSPGSNASGSGDWGFKWFDLAESKPSSGSSGSGRGQGSTQNANVLAGTDMSDTFHFKPGFGSQIIDHFSAKAGHPQDVLDVSAFASSFEALRDAGAFVQVGGDVVVMLNPADPAHSDKIILKSVNLSALDAHDFKFG